MIHPDWRLAVAAVLAAASLVSGCSDGNSSSAGSTNPPPTSSAAPATGRAGKTLEWQSCGGRVRCAKLDVPLDYGDPTGQQITLALNQVPARKPEARVWAPSGPSATARSPPL